MKYATLASIMLAGAAAKQGDNQSSQKYIQIAEGFLMGALKAEGFDDIEHCIEDGEAIIHDAESAYAHFQKKDISDIIDGVKDVADAIKQVKAALKDCSQMKADWAKFEKMALVFENPVSFSWHVAGDIIHNGVKITHEVHTGVADYKSGNFYDFGVQFGEAAAHVFLGTESQEYLKKETERMKLAKFYQGFLKAFGIDFNLLPFLICVQYEDQALMGLYVMWLAIESAIHDTDRMDMIGDILGAATAVVASYNQFESGLPWCERVTGKTIDVTPATNAMNFISDPFHNMPVMTHNLMKYEDELKDDVTSAAFYYKTEQYDKFGEFIGNIVKVMAAPEKAEEVHYENNLFLY